MMRMFVLMLLLLVVPNVVAAQETRPFQDDAGRTVVIPNRPLRIASLHDIDVTIPLIELGIAPIASHGRVGIDGKPYLRSSAILTGVDFSNSDMAFLGAVDIDLEALAEQKPDVIITAVGRTTPIATLEKIAPTIVIDPTKFGTAHAYRKLAELTGTEDRLGILDQRYRAGIEELKTAIDTKNISVSVIQPLNGKINIYHTYRALGQVLRDAGFQFPKIINDIPEGGRIEVSGERLPDVDADFIFDPYRSDTGGTSKEEIEAMDKVVPDFCGFLKACAEGRYVMVSREEAISNSYAAMALMTAVVKSAIAPRPNVR
ncbi:ABC transporter substrate-binding protein [Agrobacterium rubi]|uniref:ABC transporter substrate-binding protein n=1 Tax=Agrobacterium rubi TaxID=28099 RepID=UPI00191CC317|nr:ABC transporter substrate-binding protein [Agrobacterium rubi]NTF09443.1 ABC transporter substrate-binding protein [Agrobacterium rubi]NTF22350.1 ABC transporter substrate-binding protein [Agrobacterium rubi]NTF29207.1 ABC transporter substrate-binding protein [Agrobacterium rubi]